MKKYTIDDLKTFERDERGYLICPSGDYTAIKEFGRGSEFGDYSEFGSCSKFDDNSEFGRGSEFGKGCEFLGRSKFGKSCEFDSRSNLVGHFFENLETPAVKVVKIDHIGSRHGCTYFFQTAGQGIYVRCGCFFGSLKEFEAQVKETHKDNKQYPAEYLGAIKYIKSIMPIGDESNGN